MTDKQKKTEIIGFPLRNGNGSKTTCIEELTLDFFTFHSKDLEGLKAVLDSISSYEVFMAPKDIKKSFKDLINSVDEAIENGNSEINDEITKKVKTLLDNASKSRGFLKELLAKCVGPQHNKKPKKAALRRFLPNF